MCRFGRLEVEPKPSHLGLKYAEQFKDSSIVEAYHYRPPYPDEILLHLITLLVDEAHTILDIGCGTGDLCRRLVHSASRVDAVDFSAVMIEEGKGLPDGNDSHLHWILGRVEETALEPPYALITAGESLHWMDWSTVLPIFARSLTEHGSLAIVERSTSPTPWDEGLETLIGQFSTNSEYQPYDLVEELQKRHLFRQEGIFQSQPVVFVQSAGDFIESIHSRNGFSRQRMGAGAAEAFDHEVANLLSPYLQEGFLTLGVIGYVVWGRPETTLF
jgi:ubiquinone/menaquinone biosynthesis C-methylase UbiE